MGEILICTFDFSTTEVIGDLRATVLMDQVYQRCQTESIGVCTSVNGNRM